MFPIEFIVAGPPVPWRGRASAKRKWMSKIQSALDNAVEIPLIPTVEELRVHIRYYFRRDSPLIDPDNLAKPVLDAMESRVYHNDRQICDLRVDRVVITKPWAIESEPAIVQQAQAAGAPREFLRINIVLAENTGQ